MCVMLTLTRFEFYLYKLSKIEVYSNLIYTIYTKKPKIMNEHIKLFIRHGFPYICNKIRKSIHYL
jgi:hypothetical protein